MSDFDSPEKNYVRDFVARNREALACVSDSVFYFGELGMQEHRTCELLCSVLEEHGFQVERNISGFPTGFMATYGAGAPVIALHAEYDSNPTNSQRSGVTEKDEIVPGAPGHCEGHNVNAAVLVTSALALRHAMEKFKLRGTLKIFGAPAEEQLISRPYFVRDGYFDDVDLAFHGHILDELKTDYGLIQNASISVDFTFHGESAHAAMWPWRGRDALDAVVLMDMGVAQYREHMRTTMTAHRVITNGGQQPNVIPALASVWWYFRDSTADGARGLFEQAKKIAQGAALMTNTEVQFNVRSAVWPVLGNQTIAEVVQRNIAVIGMPRWTEHEQAFATNLQRQAKVAEDGLRPAVTPLLGPSKQIPASNDAGDVSWKVPMTRVWFPANVPHIPFHHWTGGAALATSIAHKGGEAGTLAIATSAIDFLKDPELVDSAKRSFREATAGTPYRSLLPAEQEAPVHVNEAAMEKFRPLMEPFYVKQRPHFIA
ncbi:MAG: amidohydrolase [Ramlibacter sp.]|jgi:aminobenzoyl-glutamate utilization protein B|nr:amidohydrolase [Ramlibacter sp.]MDB5912232.1 amidohydrolase [Ramlibacter sp.]